MAAPTFTPLSPALEKTLAEDLRTGRWSATTRELFLSILKKLVELEQRIAALEP